MFDGAQYFIQGQIIKFTLFGHWKRQWVMIETFKYCGGTLYPKYCGGYYQDKLSALSDIKICKEIDKKNSCRYHNRLKQVS